MSELVFKGQNDQVLTNSILVAEKFCKEPNDVVRAIDNYCKTLIMNVTQKFGTCSWNIQKMFHSPMEV